MAFWRLSNGFGTTSPIDQILESDNPSLQDLFKEHNLLHDLTSSNTKLIEYLRSPEVLKQLVQYILDVQPILVDKDEPLSAHSTDNSDNTKDLVSDISPDKNETTSEKDTEISSNPDTLTDKQSSDSESPAESIEDEDVVMKDSDDIDTPKSQDDTDNELSRENKSNDNNDDVETSDSDYDHSLKLTKSHEPTTEFSGNEDQETQNRFQDAYREEYIDEDTEANEDNQDPDDQYLNESETAQQNAHIASEILAADVWSITESFMNQQELLQELWDVLEYNPPLSMPFTTYFTKINESLLDRVTNEMLTFIKTQNNFVKNFTKHIDNPPLMDFLLKIISSDKPDYPTGIIDFLQQQNLIPSFISFLGPSIPSSVQSAAGDFLKAFVAISANSNSDNTTIGPNELSRELVGEACVKELVRLMLYGGTGLATGVGVVIEIIRKNNSDYDEISVMETTLESHPPSTRDPICLTHLVDIFAENICKFHKMLVKKHDEILKTPFGEIEPLGFERFKICELVAELLHCSNMALLNSREGAEIVKIRDSERMKLKQSLSAQQANELEDVDVDAAIDEPDVIEKATSSDKITEPSTQSVMEKTEKSEQKLETIQKDDDDEMDESPKVSEKSENHEPEKDKDENSEHGDKTIEEKFQDLNVEEPQQSATESPDGVFPSIKMFRQDPVVGDKLKIALYDNQVIIYILNMFFRFPWNNFLHNVVFDIVQQVLNGPMTSGFNRYLGIDLFDRGHITFLICDGQRLCAEYEEQHKTRLGYMGHLTLISEEVVKLTAILPPAAISPIVQQAVDTEEWQIYENETLVRTREKYNTVLGGSSPSDELEPLVTDAIILRNDDQPIELGEEDGMEEYEDDNLQRHTDEDFNSEIHNRVDLPDFNDEEYEGLDHSRDSLRRSSRDFHDDGDIGVASLDDDEALGDDGSQPAESFDKYFSQKIEDGEEHSIGIDDIDDNIVQQSDKSLDDDKVLLFRGAQNDTDEAHESQTQNEGIETPKNTDKEDGDDDDDDDDGLGLVRSKSHHELNWDSNEAQKMINQFDHFQKH